MKFTRLFLLVLLIAPAFKASSQTYFLMPEKFYLQKGEVLNLHLSATEDLVKQADAKIQPEKIDKLELYAGKKKVDVPAVAKDSASVIVSCPLTEDGLTLVSMTLKPTASEMSRSKFLRTIDADDPDKITDKVKNGNQLYYKEKFTSYTKTLVEVEKSNGNLFEKYLNDDLEIILQQNPYKFNYGDDLSAVVRFKGKPIANATVTLFVKTVGGNVFPQKLTSDATGLIYFKLSREGIYALSTRHTDTSPDKTADFETWKATYTFAFSSTNELPNTYKEFGFGDKH
jgi:hypothetical protein